MILILTIPGDPISQPRQRHRVIPGKSFVHNYTPAKAPVNDYKAAIRFAVANQHKGGLIDVPVRVDCTFVFSRPKSHFGSGKNAGKLKEFAALWHAKKPDRDNLDKALLDALTQLGDFWRDDCQVCAGEIKKVYSDQAGAVVEIRSIA